jgi:drug/metabolite transporter (DMT)-like permease
MTVIIFISFRSFTRFGVNTFHAIVCNYVVCVLTGSVYLFIGEKEQPFYNIESWLPYSIFLGFAFIGTFNLMALTTQKLSITVASVASKMSLIVPVLFSLLIFGVDTKEFDNLNYSGIILAIIAVGLSSFKKEKNVIKEEQNNPWKLLLPVSVFLLSGIIDTSFNFINIHILRPGEEGIFSLFIFGIAAIIGLLIIFIKKEKVKTSSIIGGIYLGIPNYFSVYFLILALSAFRNDGAMVFPLLNIGTILFATIFSIIIFKEKLLVINKTGIILAILAILLLSHQEISNYLTNN